MGTNVISLAEFAARCGVPSYLRQRAPQTHTPTDAGTSHDRAVAASGWAAAARRRAALRNGGTNPAHAVAEAPPRTATFNTQRNDVTRPMSACPVTPDLAGHVRLSGRLIDVCAELERLACAEAFADAATRRA